MFHLRVVLDRTAPRIGQRAELRSETLGATAGYLRIIVSKLPF